jgi:formate/nitrite transporter FocA (FNT family)
MFRPVFKSLVIIFCNLIGVGTFGRVYTCKKRRNESEETHVVKFSVEDDAVTKTEVEMFSKMTAESLAEFSQRVILKN